MIFSFAALLSTIMLSSLIMFLQIVFLKRIRLNHYLSASFLMIISIIFIIRLCFPVEFFYTKTLPSDLILPTIDTFINREVFLFFGWQVTFGKILLATWMIGSLFCLVRFCLKLHKIYLLKRIMKSNPSFLYKNRKVVIVEEPISPVVVGFFDPIILIPNLDISSVEKEFILEHELFHISNYDIWIKYLYEIVSIVYWWNPVVYIFKKSFNQIIELKADENVVSKLSSSQKIEYVETLLKVGRQINRNYFQTQTVFLSSFASSNQADLLERANTIFSGRKSKPNIFLIIIFTIICFYFSSCIVFESFVIDPEIESSTIVPTENDSFLLNSGNNQYQVYYNGDLLFEVSDEDRKIQFADFRVFNTIEQGEKYLEKIN